MTPSVPAVKALSAAETPLPSTALTLPPCPHCQQPFERWWVRPPHLVWVCAHCDGEYAVAWPPESASNSNGGADAGTRPTLKLASPRRAECQQLRITFSAFAIFAVCSFNFSMRSSLIVGGGKVHAESPE